jgi:hypothetical protein
VRKDVLLRPAGNIEQRARRKEIEAGLRKRGPALALEPFVELVLEGMEIADVARSIFALRLAELGGAPIAGLLLFRDLEAEKLFDEILEPVAVGVGADEARCRPGTLKRGGHDSEVVLHDADVEAREMVELEPIRVREQPLQVRRRKVASLSEPDEMLVALAVRQLHQAQPVAAGVEAHRLGIDRDRPVGEPDVSGQVFLVQMNGHSSSSGEACQGALVSLAPALPAP